MKRRPRSDSASQAVRAMLVAAAGPLEPPPHVQLRPGDRQFWSAVIASRARDDWSDAELVVAAQLARCQADIEREQKVLDDEGTTTENARGTQIMNPRVSVLEQLSRREMALMRALRIGGKAAGDARDLAKRRELYQSAEAVRADVSHEDSLLAG